MEYIAKNIQNKKLSESKFGTVSHYNNSENDKTLSKKKKKKRKVCNCKPLKQLRKR